MLFARYVLDLITDMLSFKWFTNWVKLSPSLWKIASKNWRFIQLSGSPACEFMLNSFKKDFCDHYNSSNYFGTNDQLHSLIVKIHAILYTSSNTEDELQNMRDAVTTFEDARIHVRSYTYFALIKALYKFCIHGLRFVPFLGFLVFDFLLPIALIVLVIDAAYFDSSWIKYENLTWFWIKAP